MLNSLESYADLGTKVGKATNHSDGHSRAFYADAFARMRNLEAPQDRDAATKAYDTAYKVARRIPV